MRRFGVPWPVWLVVVVALAAVLAWQLVGFLDDRSVDDRREAAVEVASAQVLDLTTLDADSVGEKLQALGKRVDGAFADELNSITTTFQNIVNERQLSASGSIDAVGVTSSSDSEATVVVASSALVSEGGADPVKRTFRMRVELEWIKGSWKITGMEFVS